MILNFSKNRSYAKTQVRKLAGKPFGLWKRIKNYALTHQKYLIIDGNDELIELFKHHSKLPYCTIDLRPSGILLWFKIGKDLMSLPLPYYSLTVFKGSEYFQVYGGKWRVKLAITADETNNRDLIRQILMAKHENTSDITQYYG